MYYLLMNSHESQSENPLASRPLQLIGVAGAMSVGFMLAGCSQPKAATEQPSKATTAPSPKVVESQYVDLIPDMSGFLKPGSTTTCFNGGARPCAMLVRAEPKLASDYVNADPAQQRVLWPLEAYDGQKGDTLKVKCFKPDGQTIKLFEGKGTSSVWYQLVVPEDRVLNPKVLTELRQPNPSFSVVQQGGQKAILGWASAEWFNQSTPDANVPQC